MKIFQVVRCKLVESIGSRPVGSIAPLFLASHHVNLISSVRNSLVSVMEWANLLHGRTVMTDILIGESGPKLRMVLRNKITRL